MKLLKPISEYIEILDATIISEERKTTLQPLVDYINSKSKAKQTIQLNFICTHNSRRSHLAQVWAQAMATYFSVENVHCFSGGTEATAVYPMVLKTLKNAGFKILTETESVNPIYEISYSSEKKPIRAFSKKYDDNFNPKNNFAAIMTCSQADGECPFVSGSEKQIAIMYEDPKVADGTSQQQKMYLERSAQIATEMKYVFSKISQ